MKTVIRLPLKLLELALLIATVLDGASPQSSIPTFSISKNKILQINHPRVTALLEQPQGLHQAALQVKQLSVRLDTTVASSMTLPTLVSASQGIFLVRFTDHRTIVDDNLNSVMTSYIGEVEDVLKGPRLRNVKLVVPGGSIIYSDGSVAEVRTLECDHMSDARYWLIFCVQNGTSWSLTNGDESIMSLNLKSGTLLPMSSYDGKGHVLKGPEIGTFRSLHTSIPSLLTTADAPK